MKKIHSAEENVKRTCPLYQFIDLSHKSVDIRKYEML